MRGIYSFSFDTSFFCQIKGDLKKVVYCALLRLLQDSDLAVRVSSDKLCIFFLCCLHCGSYTMIIYVVYWYLVVSGICCQ